MLVPESADLTERSEGGFMTTDKNKRLALWLIVSGFLVFFALLWVWNVVAGVGS